MAKKSKKCFRFTLSGPPFILLTPYLWWFQKFLRIFSISGHKKTEFSGDNFEKPKFLSNSGQDCIWNNVLDSVLVFNRRFGEWHTHR